MYKLSIGSKFTNVHMPDTSFEILLINPLANQLRVEISPLAKGRFPWQEVRNLQHSQRAFEVGEYRIAEDPAPSKEALPLQDVKKIIPKGSYFVGQCGNCGYKCSSEEWDGAGQIADTGDYGDPLCPMCGSKDVDEADDDIYIDQREMLVALIKKQNVSLMDRDIDLYNLRAEIDNLKTRLSSPSPRVKTGVEEGFTKEEIALQKRHTEMLEDKLTRLDKDYMKLVRENKWIACKDKLPDEGGRYWCYCSQLTDLVTSHFQWNCSYDPDTKTFSDNLERMNVTHWTNLLPTPSSPSSESKEPGELDRVIESVAGDCPKKEEAPIPGAKFETRLPNGEWTRTLEQLYELIPESFRTNISDCLGVGPGILPLWEYVARYGEYCANDLLEKNKLYVKGLFTRISESDAQIESLQAELAELRKNFSSITDTAIIQSENAHLLIKVRDELKEELAQAREKIEGLQKWHDSHC